MRYFLGKYLHSPNRGLIDVLDDTLVCVDDVGKITAILASTDAEFNSSVDQAKTTNRLTIAPSGTFFIPGFVDLHIHAPQWPQLGKALHLPLQDWLQKATFPLEARYEDIDFATGIYTSLVDNLLANGTTSAVYFATTHVAATTRLADICVAKGQRAWVGRVAMDDAEQCPDYYRDASTEEALLASEDSLNTIKRLSNNQKQRVKPILTPRFIPSCTDELLNGLGSLAMQHQCHVQTHCSESDWEHQFVIDRLGKSDTQALENFGLLTRKTVLAHANFIGQEDMHTIKQCGSGIAHCPLSNQYFSGSVFPLKTALDKGLHVGLGTDISGGHSASQLDTCRHTIGASRLLDSGVNPDIQADNRGRSGSQVNFKDAFYLATAAGGVVLDEPIGQFAVGYQFDAILVDPDAMHSNVQIFNDMDSDEDRLQKTLCTATRCNIREVFVEGKLVSGS